MKKRFFAAFMSVVMMLSLLPASVVPVLATGTDTGFSEGSGIETTKIAQEVESFSENNPVYEIALNAKATSNVTWSADPIDIILVLDTSEQMWEQTTTYARFQANDAAAAVAEQNRRKATTDEECLFYMDAEGSYRRISSVSQDKTTHDWVLSFPNDAVKVTDNQWFNKVYTRNRSRASETNYLAEMQEAANQFIEDCWSPNGERRIAIVSYNDTSSILTTAQTENLDHALIPVNTEGMTYLQGVVDSLSLTKDSHANVNKGMNDARKIFQDGQQKGDTSTAVQGDMVPDDRQRMVILLSAGIYGNGKLETFDNYSVAMQSIHISAILKTPRGENAVSGYSDGTFDFKIDPIGYFVDGGTRLTTVSGETETANTAERTKYAALGLNFGEGAQIAGGPAFDGCGAKLYVVGLGMPETKSRWEGDTLVEWKGGNLESEGSRINELFYRLSSHRPDGTHPPFEGNDHYSWDLLVPVKLVDKNGSAIYGDYSAMAEAKPAAASVTTTTNDDGTTAVTVRPGYTQKYYDYWAAQYMDELCRNIDPANPVFQSKNANGKTYLGADGSYFLTTNEADELTGLFQNIAQQNGAKHNVIVRDYISDYFVPCDSSGNPLQIGDRVDGGGVVCKDANGWYIEWEKVEIAPESVDSSGTVTGDAKTFGASFYVKPVDSFLGGNQVPTNKDDSGIYEVTDAGENRLVTFAEPNVDVPIKELEAAKDQNIYLSNQADLKALADILTIGNPIDNAFVTIEYVIKSGDAVVGTYSISPGQTTGSWTWEGDAGPAPVLTEDTDYSVTCTVTPTKTGQYDATEKAGTATVFVFDPVFNFKDATYAYGDVVEDYSTANLNVTTWYNAALSKNSSAVAMQGSAPNCVLTYTPEEGTMDSTSDIPVNVNEVKIGGVSYSNHASFTWTACDPDCEKNITKHTITDESAEFYLHIDSTTLSSYGNGNYALGVSKTLDGRDWNDSDAFTFTLTPDENNASSSVMGDKSIRLTKDATTGSFGDITYYQAGTYSYTISETEGENESLDYSGAEYAVTVTVAKNDTDHQLEVTNVAIEQVKNDQGDDEDASITGSTVSFTNTYRATGELDGDTKLVVSKELIGRDWKAGDSFTFALTGENGAPMPAESERTVTISGTGTHIGNFGDITYSTEDIGKTYEYTVAETSTSGSGITVDSTVYTIRVTVTDNGDGTLTATPIYKVGNTEYTKDSMVFTNEYDATGILYGNKDLKISKTLTGRDWENSDCFSFSITGSTGAPMPEVANILVDKEHQNTSFGNINYTLADKDKTYTYTIEETTPAANGITPDGKEYTVTVTVTDNGDGTLNVVPSYVEGEYGNNGFAFTNTYNATGTLGGLVVRKTIENRAAWLDTDSYTFTLTGKDNAPMPTGAVDGVQTITIDNDSAGSTTKTNAFGSIQYGLADIGKTYTYTVQETPKNGNGITTDTTKYTIIVSVADNDKDGSLDITATVNGKGDYDDSDLSFKNVYKATGELDGDTRLKISKTINDRADDAWASTDTYTFTLSEGQTVIESIDIGKDTPNHTANFGDITYDESDIGKTYTYTVKETAKDGKGITTDTTIYTVSVKITDNGDGTLDVKPTYQTGDRTYSGDTMVFTNEYNAKGTLDGDTALKVTKTLTGRSWQETDAFYVEISAKDSDSPMPSGDAVLKFTNTDVAKDSVSATFGDIAYTEKDIGTHVYEVKEVYGYLTDYGQISRITYDTTVYTVTVTVTDKYDGTLDVTTSYSSNRGGWFAKDEAYTYGNDGLTFVNRYTKPSKPTTDTDIEDDIPLNTEDHYAYIIGYPDGEVKPGHDITRAEVATIFFRLLTDEARDLYWSTENDYPDVKQTQWFNNAISTLTNAGIINGYNDGTFRPNEPITRAEFAKIAVSFFSYVDKEYQGLYPDVPANMWYALFVEAASELGLIEGYPDGTFRPNEDITRAEACTIVNRTIQRKPHEDQLHKDMIVWPDNPAPGEDGHMWYYEQVQEATNSHDYDFKDEYESWTEILENRDWAALEKAWADSNDAPGGEVMK